MSKQETKVYYAFTKPKHVDAYLTVDGEITVEYHIPLQRATVALIKEGDKYKYGVAICSTDDNFNRSTGKRLAENRLKEGFGEIEVSKLENLTKTRKSDETKLLAVLHQIKSGVEDKLPKYKRKVTKWNKERISKEVM